MGEENTHYLHFSIKQKYAIFQKCKVMGPGIFTSYYPPLTLKLSSFNHKKTSNYAKFGQNTRSCILQYCAGCLQDGDKCFKCLTTGTHRYNMPASDANLYLMYALIQYSYSCCALIKKPPAGFRKETLTKASTSPDCATITHLSFRAWPGAGFHLLMRHTVIVARQTVTHLERALPFK